MKCCCIFLDKSTWCTAWDAASNKSKAVVCANHERHVVLKKSFLVRMTRSLTTVAESAAKVFKLAMKLNKQPQNSGRCL